MDRLPDMTKFWEWSPKWDIATIADWVEALNVARRKWKEWKDLAWQPLKAVVDSLPEVNMEPVLNAVACAWCDWWQTTVVWSNVYPANLWDWWQAFSSLN